jgi:hypothetical protein
MDLRGLRDALGGLEGVVAIELEGSPATAMRVLVETEAAGEQLTEIPLLLLSRRVRHGVDSGAPGRHGRAATLGRCGGGAMHESSGL